MIRRTALDAVVSDCVREAADWTCQKCGLEFPDRKSRNLHASHFISRAYNSTRYFVDNLFALCGKCHDEVGKDPHLHAAFVRSQLGDVRYEWLVRRKAGIYRYRESDKKAMRKHYAAELERIKEMRRNGATGPLGIYAYD